MIWREIEEFKSKIGLRRGMRTPKSDLKNLNYKEDRRLHLNRSLPLWVLPSQIRQTEDSQADGKLKTGFSGWSLFSWWYLKDIWRQRPGRWKAETFGLLVGVWVAYIPRWQSQHSSSGQRCWKRRGSNRTRSPATQVYFMETRKVVYHGQNRRSRCHPLRLKDKDIFS